MVLKKNTTCLIQGENCAIFGATVGKGVRCDDIITTLRNIAGGSTVQYFLCNLMLYFQDCTYGVFPVE